MQRLKLAVAGTGSMGRHHIELIQQSTDCELSAVADPMPLASDGLNALGVAQYAELAELLAQARPDGVILATPNALHASQARQCIEAGVAVLVEKPVAHSVEEGRRLLELAKVSNTPVLVGHHRAHSPVLAKAREIIASGVLGDLVAVQGSALFYKPTEYFDAAPWRQQPGGGPVLINMIHEIGNLRSLCGEIVAVQALQSNAARGFAVEDTVSVGLRFASGALGSFLLSDCASSARSWEQTSGENPDYPRYDDEDCYVICGKGGSLAIPTLRLKYHAEPQSRSWWQPMQSDVERFERQDPLVAQLAHFCQVIQGKAAPLVSVHDGLRNLIIVEAIAEAARTGQVVPTPSE